MRLGAGADQTVRERGNSFLLFSIPLDARFFPLRDDSSETFYLRESAPLFRKAAEKLQVPPTDSLAFEDSVSRVRGQGQRA